MNLPKKLTNKLKLREENNSLRKLSPQNNLIDFSSNDYLGLSKSESIFNETHRFLVDRNIKQNGATGSRLLSGNHSLYTEVERFLSEFHQTASATIFNAGYDANIGFFSAVPQRNDFILYDEFSHASIRDGIQLSNAKSYKFLHNNLEDLVQLLKRVQHEESEIFVVTEAVFSMDGDAPDLIKLAAICKQYNAFLIVDEAHAVGVFNKNGYGLVQELHLQNDVFARIVTFGKAIGCHGAAILGNQDLQNYLVNFARSFIYTTGLTPHSLATIRISYNEMQKQFQHNNNNLSKNIEFFTSEIKKLGLKELFIESNSAIHCCVISGNEKVKSISKKFKEKGFDVKAILSPTVPENKERLRFCLHAYNSTKEITDVLKNLATFVKE
jgi:8-amino-7-oxononanoate synthase